MNNLTRTQYRLAQMFALCRAMPNYKALYACGQRWAAKDTLGMALTLLEDDARVNFQTSCISFRNGSTLHIKALDMPSGYEFHTLFVDELVDREMAEWAKTRERL